MHVKYLNLCEFDTCYPFGGLHCASFFGIVELVAAWIETESDDADGGIFQGIHDSHGLLIMGVPK